MPKNWETKVVTATKSWNESEMDRFLEFLEKRIGKEEALKRIRSLSYFKEFRFQSFLKRVRLYERYIGRAGVIERMKKDLKGFSDANPDQLEQKEKEWGKQKMQDMLQKYSLRNPVFSI